MEETEAGLKLQITPKLREFLTKVAAIAAIPDECRAAALKFAEDLDVVPFAFIRDVYGELGPGHRTPLHRVLVGSSFVLDSPKPREKSEELKARLRKLQEISDKREYEELVHDITKHTEVPESFSSYKDQLGFGLHVTFTMFTGFMLGYAILRAQFPDSSVVHATGGALGLIIGLLVETSLFIIRDVQKEQMEEISRREKSSSHTSSRKEI